MDWLIFKKLGFCFVLNIKQHGVRADTTVRCFWERNMLLVLVMAHDWDQSEQAKNFYVLGAVHMRQKVLLLTEIKL